MSPTCYGLWNSPIFLIKCCFLQAIGLGILQVLESDQDAGLQLLFTFDEWLKGKRRAV